MEALLAYQGPMKHVNHAHRLVVPTGRIVVDPDTGEPSDINDILDQMEPPPNPAYGTPEYEARQEELHFPTSPSSL